MGVLLVRSSDVMTTKFWQTLLRLVVAPENRIAEGFAVCALAFKRFANEAPESYFFLRAAAFHNVSLVKFLLCVSSNEGEVMFCYLLLSDVGLNRIRFKPLIYTF